MVCKSSCYLFNYQTIERKTFESLKMSKTAAEIVYISESNENWEKYSTQRWTPFSALLIYVIGDKILLIKVLEN